MSLANGADCAISTPRPHGGPAGHDLRGAPRWRQPRIGRSTGLELCGLDDHDARSLLETMLPGRLDERVRGFVLSEAGGNPLALRELHTALTPGDLAGGYGLANAKSLTARIERIYGHRLRELPSQTSTLLLIAAAEPAARPEWLWAAAQHLGIGVVVATTKRARIELRIAYDSFVKVCADAFAQRARRELQATGETVRARSTKTAVELTTQDSQIARLAREGYTNSEIAGQLFLSPRTVSGTWAGPSPNSVSPHDANCGTRSSTYHGAHRAKAFGAQSDALAGDIDDSALAAKTAAWSAIPLSLYELCAERSRPPGKQTGSPDAHNWSVFAAYS